MLTDDTSPILHLNGAEYGVGIETTETKPNFSNEMPGEHGRDYKYNSAQSLEFLATRGWTHVKLPIRWERIQEDIGGALRISEVILLREFLDSCQAVGIKCVIEIHNHGVYYEDVDGVGVRRVLGTPELPLEALDSLWSQLAYTFGSHPATFGYAIMSGPQASGLVSPEVWKDASQVAVNAVRLYDSLSEIHVEGWDKDKDAWLSDPVGGVIRYSMTHYWDSDSSGSYSRTYDQELATAESQYDAGDNQDALHTKVITELDTFAYWLMENDVNGIVGEMGWSGVEGDYEKWNELGLEYVEYSRYLMVPLSVSFASEWATVDHPTRLYNGGVRLKDPQPQTLIWEEEIRHLRRRPHDEYDTPTSLPREYTFGKVVARVIQSVADGSDSNRYPDAKPATGYVTFRPQQKSRKTENYSALVLNQSVRCTLYNPPSWEDPKYPPGTLIDPEGNIGVWLTTGTYDVDFQLNQGGHPPMRITVTEEYDAKNPLDLIHHTPPTPPEGVQMVTAIIPPGGRSNQTLVRDATGLLKWQDILDDETARRAEDAALASYDNMLITERHAARIPQTFIQDTPPENPQEGDFWLDTSNRGLYDYRA